MSTYPEFTDAFAPAPRVIQRVGASLAAKGLTWTLERNFSELRQFHARVGNPMNPCFDPEVSDINNRSFWIGTWARGELVATIGERWWPDAEYGELLRMGTLFRREGYGDGLASGFFHPLSERVAGRLVHAGCLYVQYPWRGAKLSKILPRLGRALIDITAGFDWYTAIAFGTLHATGLPQANYGYVRSWEKVIDGHFPETKTNVSVWTAWMSTEESRRDLTYFLEADEIDAHGNDHVDRVSGPLVAR